jgi:hypothetical protein
MAIIHHRLFAKRLAEENGFWQVSGGVKWMAITANGEKSFIEANQTSTDLKQLTHSSNQFFVKTPERIS